MKYSTSALHLLARKFALTVYLLQPVTY